VTYRRPSINRSGIKKAMLRYETQFYDVAN
jgi:hypothetical protein